MASTMRNKMLCSKCRKAARVFKCSGCQKDFCYQHVAEHRQELNKEMDEVTVSHDQLQQTIAEQNAQPASHPLMKKIEQWEKQSIAKIRKAADESRKQLLTVAEKHRTKVSNDLQIVTKELNKARKDDDYVEIDLKEWAEKLDQLKKTLASAQAIDFGENHHGSALIPKIFIRGSLYDFFEQLTGDGVITQEGMVVEHGPTTQHGLVRGRGEYSNGQHRFRFQIEQLSANQGFSLGVVSKTTPIELVLQTSGNGSMYGNYGRSGQHTSHGFSSFEAYNNNMQKNDVLELLVDCDTRRILLNNGRTHSSQLINVDLHKCPFPWHFFVTLLYPRDRVRFLDVSKISTEALY